MDLICVNNSEGPLTIGKKYTGYLTSFPGKLLIQHDNGWASYFPESQKI